MDNHIVDIRSQGREAFDHALAIFMGSQMGGYKTATHTSIIPPGTELPKDNYRGRDSKVCDPKAPTFCLFWSAPKEWKIAPVKELPYKMKKELVGDMLWSWLEDVPREQWGEWIDHDGSMGRGFRMWNESWTHVGGSFYGICAVRPICAWYGK
jgi:hypothetical protein